MNSVTASLISQGSLNRNWKWFLPCTLLHVQKKTSDGNPSGRVGPEPLRQWEHNWKDELNLQPYSNKKSLNPEELLYSYPKSQKSQLALRRTAHTSLRASGPILMPISSQYKKKWANTKDYSASHVFQGQHQLIPASSNYLHINSVWLQTWDF